VHCILNLQRQAYYKYSREQLHLLGINKAHQGATVINPGEKLMFVFVSGYASGKDSYRCKTLDSLKFNREFGLWVIVFQTILFMQFELSFDRVALFLLQSLKSNVTYIMTFIPLQMMGEFSSHFMSWGRKEFQTLPTTPNSPMWNAAPDGLAYPHFNPECSLYSCPMCIAAYSYSYPMAHKSNPMFWHTVWSELATPMMLPRPQVFRNITRKIR
jgi:hypothetical protein